MSGQSIVTRREALRGLGLMGLGAVVSACGGGDGGSSATATPAPTSSPNSAPSATPTSLPTGTPPPTVAPSQTATGTPPASPSPSSTATTAASETPTRAATATPTIPSCVLSPQQTQGPFYLDLDLLRSDIREDRDAIALRLTLQLVDVDGGCAPIRDAVVNVWHADASGAYSGFPGQPGGIDTTGETFLRGYQVTDAN